MIVHMHGQGRIGWADGLWRPERSVNHNGIGPIYSALGKL